MHVCVCVFFQNFVRQCIWISLYSTLISIIIEGHETAFNGFEYQFTTGKPLKDLKLTLNYYGNGRIVT